MKTAMQVEITTLVVAFASVVVAAAAAIKNGLFCTSVQFSSVQSPDRLGRRVDMRDDSEELFFQSFSCRMPL